MLRLKCSGDIKKIVIAQVGDVRKEQALRSKIPRLTAVEDKVSQAVRNQYEDNPYPRWINAGLSDKPRPIRKVLQAIKVHHNLDAQQFSDKPDVLVAGCGTGHVPVRWHPLIVGTRDDTRTDSCGSGTCEEGW